jgi:hypothetical protein
MKKLKEVDHDQRSMPFEFLQKIEEVQSDLERINVAATVFFGDLSISVWFLATCGWIAATQMIQLPLRVTMSVRFPAREYVR